METPDTFWNLFAGYSLFWGLVALFVFKLVFEQKKIRDRLSKLEKEVGSSE